MPDGQATALARRAGRRLALPIDPFDERTHQLRAVYLGKASSGLLGLVKVFFRACVFRGVSEINQCLPVAIRGHHFDGSVRPMPNRTAWTLSGGETCGKRGRAGGRPHGRGNLGAAVAFFERAGQCIVLRIQARARRAINDGDLRRLPGGVGNAYVARVAGSGRRRAFDDRSLQVKPPAAVFTGITDLGLSHREIELQDASRETGARGRVVRRLSFLFRRLRDDQGARDGADARATREREDRAEDGQMTRIDHAAKLADFRGVALGESRARNKYYDRLSTHRPCRGVWRPGARAARRARRGVLGQLIAAIRRGRRTRMHGLRCAESRRLRRGHLCADSATNHPSRPDTKSSRRGGHCLGR